MQVFKIVKVAIFLVISLAIMIPAWYTFLDRRHKYCTIEEFNAGKYRLYNHLIIAGNALFQYAYRNEEYSADTLYNITYYVPFVDSLWTVDKPIETILLFESGKMAFESGFDDAVNRLDHMIDSLAKLKSNRITLTGNNKMLEFSKLNSETQIYFENTFHLTFASRFSMSKIVINEHFSMPGFIFMTIFTTVIGVLFYLFAKKMFLRRNRKILHRKT
jgi:hypothetical protein